MAKTEEIEIASKMLDTLRVLGKKRNVIYKWCLGISILLISISLKIIEVTDTISLSFINIKIDINNLAIITSIALVILQQNCGSIMISTTELEERVVEIYKNLIPDSVIIKESDYKFLEYPDNLSNLINDRLFSNSFFGKIHLILSYIFISTLIYFLSIFAQFVAFIELKDTYINQWWFYLIFLFIGFFQITIVYSMYKQYRIMLLNNSNINIE